MKRSRKEIDAEAVKEYEEIVEQHQRNVEEKEKNVEQLEKVVKQKEKDTEKIIEQYQKNIEQLEATLKRREAVVKTIADYIVKKSGEKKPPPPDADPESISLWETEWNMQTLKDAQRNQGYANDQLNRAKDDLKSAKDELKSAKDELNRANDKLNRANDQLNRAKDELNRAKDELKKLPLSQQELDLFINVLIDESKQNLHTSLPDTDEVTKRIDTCTVQDQLSKLSESVSTLVESEKLQYTKAAVLIGTSGLGKTFTALTYPSRDKADASKAYVNIYLGLNNKCDLTSTEEKYITNGNVKRDEAVATVILGRLIAFLSVLKEEGYPERPADSDIHLFVPQICCDTLIFRIISSDRWPQNTNAFYGMAALLLADLQAAKGKPTVVLINVDEAQFLDRCVTNGAKYALRCLRTLQRDVVHATNGLCVPLGFATGIKPNCFLQENTEGSNTFIEGTIMSKEDFEELAMKYKNKFPEQTCRSLAVLCYPRVRMLIRLLKNGANYSPSGMEMNKTECVKLLDHFIRGDTMPLDQIPLWCVHWGIKGSANNLRLLQIDYPIWGILLKTIDNKIPEHVSMPVEIIPKVETAFFVEGAFGAIIYAILYLMFLPLPGLEAAAAHYRCHKGAALQAALGLQPQENISVQLYQGSPNDTKQNYHPFPHANDHATAFQSGKLSDRFQVAVTNLEKIGESVLFFCGGSAPLDYLHVRLSNTNELVVWYADSKTHLTESFTQILSDARKVAKRALEVHWGLLHLNPQTIRDFSCHYTVSVLTNVVLTVEEIAAVQRQTRLPVDLSQLCSMEFDELPEEFDEQEDVPRTPGVIVLCPTNFTFEPLTRVMYRAANEKAFYNMNSDSRSI